LGKILKPILHFVALIIYRVKKVGEENVPKEGAFVLCGNHVHALDAPAIVLTSKRKVVFLAKAELFENKILKWLADVFDIIPVKRGKQDLESMKRSLKAISKGEILGIFPEGTRTRTGDVGKFYSAGFRKLVESSNLPVVVCALDGGYKIRDLNKILTNLQRGCYRVKILKIYDNPKTKEECINLLDEAKELIQQELDNWRKLPTTQM